MVDSTAIQRKRKEEKLNKSRSFGGLWLLLVNRICIVHYVVAAAGVHV